MKTYRIPNTDLDASVIGYGCMTIGGRWDGSSLTSDERAKATHAVMTAFENGITLFDHADIYCRGKSETVFGEILRQHPSMREKIILQSKCGIRMKDDPHAGDPFRYDFSRDHIIRSVEGSLRRLQTDRLDILLLHRPDPLVEPEEVTSAFQELEKTGKVRYFGVSNHTAQQIALLQSVIKQRIIINQVELNLLHSSLIADGVVANTNDVRYTASAGTLDYCRQQKILIQAWAPLAGGKLTNPAHQAEDRIHHAASLITGMAGEKQTSKEAILLAWLLKHPAQIQPIIGTTVPERITNSILATEVNLTRVEWYELLSTARGEKLP